jgi:hypothetical protein
MNIKENEKQGKYKDLETKVNRLWKKRTKIVPITTGVFGKIMKGFDRNFSCVWATEWPKDYKKSH